MAVALCFVLRAGRIDWVGRSAVPARLNPLMSIPMAGNKQSVCTLTLTACDVNSKGLKKKKTNNTDSGGINYKYF